MRITEFAITGLTLGRALHISKMSTPLREAHRQAVEKLKGLWAQEDEIIDGIRLAVEAEIPPLSADEMRRADACARARAAISPNW